MLGSASPTAEGSQHRGRALNRSDLAILIEHRWSGGSFGLAILTEHGVGQRTGRAGRALSMFASLGGVC